MHSFVRICLVATVLCTGGGALAQAPVQRPQPAPAPLPAAPSPAPATVLSDSAKAVLGSWEFSNADRDKVCSITLKADPAPIGFRIEFDDRCAGAFALVSDVVGWRLADNDLLRFLDAAGKSLVEFSEVEGGIYEAPTPGYGVLFLQTSASLAPPPPSMEQIAGEWSMQRAGQTICMLTLLNKSSGDDGFALQLQPRCDAAVTRFNPVNWRVDRGELVLTSPEGDTWRFAQTEGATWQRVPERPDSLTMTHN